MSRKTSRKLTRQTSMAQFTKGLSYGQVENMRSLFALCDKDGDGEISLSELGDIMGQLGVNHTPAEITAMFTQLDVDGSQTISFNEFLGGLRWMQKSRKLSRQSSMRNFVSNVSEEDIANMTALFQDLDVDGDGELSKKELYQVFNELGMKHSKEEFLELFRSLDQNGDGKIGLEEFIGGFRWMSKGVNISAAAAEEEEESEDDDLEKQLQSLAEQNTILQRYLSGVVGRVLAVAESKYKGQEYEDTQSILKALDLDTLFEMEHFIGLITTPKQKDHHAKMSRRLQKLKL
eukprot:TRINITY_DN378_c1_g1_i1.p1 TRINITY_DN378_c1_g1~~TRINITY_DN378_c1_g1_i1.p1  ORF type:complete len:315 (+),score=103.72 TRINITY_DN378_c1_g1_i1:78-947(+)